VLTEGYQEKFIPLERPKTKTKIEEEVKETEEEVKKYEEEVKEKESI